MTYDSSPSSATPIYHRIQECLRSDIAAGRFADGDRLPSESELARTFQTTRGTVRQALARLEYEGLIQREAGRGTFATPSRVQSRIDTRFYQSFEEQLSAQGALIALRVIDFSQCAAPEGIAQVLRVLAGADVHRLRRLRLVDDELVGYEDRWMLSELGRRLRPAALKTESAIALMSAALRAPLGQIEVFVRASAATAEVAELLEVRKGAPVLVRAHTFYDRNRRPVLTGQAVYRGDRYQFAYALDGATAAVQVNAVP
jgi:GntR family transcriptional regulator